ncbi:hypothetical protein [Spirosoma areae]
MVPTSTIWVKHPTSGKEINVAPLILLLDELDAPPNSHPCAGVSDVLHRTIRTLNVTVHDQDVSPVKHIADLYRDLHSMEDAFQAVTVREAA